MVAFCVDMGYNICKKSVRVGEVMGKKRVDCEECGTSYDRTFLVGKQGNLGICPMCGAPIDLEGKEETLSYDEPSFGDDVELGENDSFDEDKIDFYYNGIVEPDELGKGEDGLTGGTCAKCGTHTSFLYPIAKTKGYILLKPREKGKCSKCGKELKNHILAELPADWVDPRQKEMWVKDYMHMPKCPICSSTKIHKISVTNKAASAITFGILAAGHVSKTYKCDICGAKF